MKGTSKRKLKKNDESEEEKRKLKDTIKKLKTRNRHLKKKLKFYENKEIEDSYNEDISEEIYTPKEEKQESLSEFRKRFYKEFKEGLKKK